MGCSFGEMCECDLALRSALGVGQHGAPVLLVTGIHPATDDARVDLGEQIEEILPRVDPIDFPLGSLDEAVHRHPQRSDDLSHLSSPFKCIQGTGYRSIVNGWSLASPVVERDTSQSTAGGSAAPPHAPAQRGGPGPAPG